MVKKTPGKNMSNKQLNMRNLLLRKKTCSFHTIENGACHRVAVSFGVPRSFRFALFHALVFKHVFTKFGWGGGCQSFFFPNRKKRDRCECINGDHCMWTNMSIWKTGKWLVFTGNLISCTGFRLLRFFFQCIQCFSMLHVKQFVIH